MDRLGEVLVVGCGYLGSRVATLAAAAGSRVWVTTRSRTKAAELYQQGYSPILADWTDARTLDHLPRVGRVLVAVSYDSRQPASRYDAQVGGLRNLLKFLDDDVDISYISTTGVYHQTDGSWVDERSTANPSREGGRVHLQAEGLLHRHRPEGSWSIFRLAGIYGPGRVPRVADIVAGRPIASPATGYLNLIHVDDAASAVMAAWRRRAAGDEIQRLYCVADDQPMHRTEFYAEVARQASAPPPVFLTRPPIRSAAETLKAGGVVPMRSQSDKRIWNRRLKADLMPRLAYPTYREGLADVLAGGSRTERT